VSRFSEEACFLLTEIFPRMKIRREDYVLYEGQKLFLDIWLPQLSLVVEIHGRQHDEFVEHFHNTAENFRAAKRRDRIKEEWAALNGHTYVVLREKDFPLTKEKLLDIIDAASRHNEQSE